MIVIYIGKPAPVLHYDGDKWGNQSTYKTDEKGNKKGVLFYQCPMPLMDYICSVLHHQDCNYLKLMMVLIGTDEGFRISEKWILARTGMTKSVYIKVRKGLSEMKWIDYDSINHTITINYEYLWNKTFETLGNKKEASEKDSDQQRTDSGELPTLNELLERKKYWSS